MNLESLAVISTFLVSTTAAISLSERVPNPRTVGLHIRSQKRPWSPIADHNRLSRRQNVVSESLENGLTTYYAEVTVGTPTQQLHLHIDTGSSDMWTNVASSALCQSGRNVCQGGTYDSSSSSTYEFVNSDFNISYADGSAAVGDYVKDTLQIGGKTLTNFQFGLGQSSTTGQGVLGVGYAGIEAQVDHPGSSPYPNLPQAMVDAGLINSNAYSLWLNDLDANTGTIMFGGVNTAKYTGELATIPIIPVDGLNLEFIIALTGLIIAGTDLSSSSSLPAAVLLDSGSSLTYLPEDVTTGIFDAVHAVYDSREQAAYVDCNLKNQNSNIDFTFSGQKISVPYNELIVGQATASNGQPLTFSNGDTACIFGIAPIPGSQAVLGDTFLRSAYVVYDLQSNEISLAQTNFDGSSDDVREITRSDGVPGAKAVANPVTTLAAGGAGASIAGATITIGSAPTALSNADGMSKEISGALAGMAAVGALFFQL